MSQDPKAQTISSIVKAKAELEEALSQIEQLPAFDPGTISFAAHALNNYLTVNVVTVELLRATLKDHSDQQIHTWLGALQHVSNLMTHTVSQLVNTADPGKFQLRFEKVDFPLFAQRGCQYYQRIADRKNIQVIFQGEKDMPPIWTDRVAAGAVLDNLLSNAVKFSQPGSEIHVRVAKETASGICHVTDGGPGLSPDDQMKLFQKGVCLSAVPTGGETSTGFGLAVAKGLIDELGGHLSCQSELGQGSCFSMALPLYDQELHRSV